LKAALGGVSVFLLRPISGSIYLLKAVHQLSIKKLIAVAL
jgi:hypothetical protein